METPITSSRIWRILALISVVTNIFLNYWINVHPFGGKTIGEVSAEYPVLFTPAGYAFSIWGLIYLSFIGYVIYQLLPAQRAVTIYDRLAKPLILTSLLSIIWLVCFSFQRLGWSVLLISCMLLTALILFVRTKEWLSTGQRPGWLTIPFSLYAGWLTVAIIANATTWLYDLGWRGGTFGEASWTIGMIGVAVGIGMLISWYFLDWIYPLVIAWASLAIWVARKDAHPTVATTALLGAGVLLIWVIGERWWRSKSPRAAVLRT